VNSKPLTAELHDRHRRRVGEHHGHLQQDPQLVAHVVCGHPVEGLRAVAALEQEGLAARDRTELALEVVALPGEHQGRHASQLRHGRVESVRTRPGRLLGRSARAQRIEIGDR
jgi:hypothetical protein